MLLGSGFLAHTTKVQQIKVGSKQVQSLIEFGPNRSNRNRDGQTGSRIVPRRARLGPHRRLDDSSLG